MNVFSLLSKNFIPFDVEGVGSVSLNWIGKIISWIFDAFSGVYGGAILGVVIFTLILKTIVLPLDAYSRVKTKKQALIMEEMRPQMEKLKKQYANDNKIYSQKVMELQKQHGYSPLSACLPMIVSLVIFIIVIGAFSTYSNYAIINTYNDMVGAYNASVETYVSAVYKTDSAGNVVVVDGEVQYEEVNADGFLRKEPYMVDGNFVSDGYVADYDKFLLVWEEFKATSDDATVIAEIDGLIEKYGEGGANAQNFMDDAVVSFVQLNARREAAKYYRESKKNYTFGWIGNVWYPDSALNKVVPNYKNFKSSISRASTASAASYEESYNEVTYYLRNADPANPGVKLEANTPNGYFVLIVLAIGLMFLQQFVLTRSQKAATELSSVDGSAAKTNKWMMIIMPIIYGVFSFFYSAAFSTYMIINTSYGLLTTLLINKLVAIRFAKYGVTTKRKQIASNNRKRLK